MDGSAFSSLGLIFSWQSCLTAVVFFGLGLWKLIEIAIWIYSHIHWS